MGFAINPTPDAGKDAAWWKQPTAPALLLANLIPLAGVLFFHWSLFTVLLLFWFDNVVIGLYMIARNRYARPYRRVGLGHGSLKMQNREARFGAAVYFFFTALHGFFLIAIFGTFELRQMGQPFRSVPNYLAEVLQRPAIAVAVLALVVSRGIELYEACQRPQEFAKSKASDEMGMDFGRVIVLHLVILFGGGLAVVLGAPVATVVLLILLKSAGDTLGLAYRRGASRLP